MVCSVWLCDYGEILTSRTSIIAPATSMIMVEVGNVDHARIEESNITMTGYECGEEVTDSSTAWESEKMFGLHESQCDMNYLVWMDVNTTR